MRSKFVLGILLPVVLIIGLAIVFKERSARTSPGEVSVVAAPAPNPAANNPSPLAPPVTVLPAPVHAAAAAKPMTEAEIAAETDRLNAWEMSNDPQSLSNILADLNSPEKEIRAAAIEAAMQFDSSNAIPALKAAAANDQDPEEKDALLQAADYLSTPALDIDPNSKGAPMTPDQVKAAQQEESQDAANRQAQRQRSKSQNANSSAPASQPPPQ